MDLYVDNSCTILKYNLGASAPTRRDFLKNLCMQLCLPLIKSRAKITNLHSSTIMAIKSVLELANDSLPTVSVPSNIAGKKCSTCIRNLRGLKDAERRAKKGRLNSVKFQCKVCNAHACILHRVASQGKCINCTNI